MLVKSLFAYFLIILINVSNGVPPQFFELEADHIEDYTIQQFLDNVLYSNRATIIKFYADWCGSSKKFKNIWKNFAKETRRWHKKVLRVAALDCVLENQWENEICDDNGVNWYPQIRIFGVKAKNVTGATIGNEKTSVDEFMKNVIDYLELLRHPPREWPLLFPFT